MTTNVDDGGDGGDADRQQCPFVPTHISPQQQQQQQHSLHYDPLTADVHLYTYTQQHKGLWGTAACVLRHFPVWV